MEWLERPFERYRAQRRSIVATLSTARMAVTSTRLTSRLVQLLPKLQDIIDVSQDEIAGFKQLEERARALIQTDFAEMYGLGTIALWSALENLVHELVAGMLWAQLGRVEERRREKLRVPLELALSDDQEAKAWWAFDELRKSLGAGLKQGAGQFESLLEVVGLGGGIDDVTRDTLFEFSNVRNILAHKSGIVDARAKANCPALPEQVGEPVKVDSKRFGRFAAAGDDYSVLILKRLKTSFAA